MTKKSILIAIILIVAIFAVDRLLGKLLSKAALSRMYDNRIELLLSKELKDNDLFIIGESAGARNISAELLSEYLGLSVYNLSFPGANLVFHNMLIDIISNDKAYNPKAIILTLNERGLTNNNAKSVGGLSFRQDIANTYIYDPTIFKFLIDNSNRNEILSKISFTYKNNGNYNNALAYLFEGKEKEARRNKISEKGSMLIDVKSKMYESMEFGKEPTYFSDLEIDSLRLKSLLNSIKLAEQNDIQLIILLSPEYRIPTTGFKEFLLSLSDQIIVMEMTDKMPNKSHYYDRVHLDEKGAIIFSELLAMELKKIRL